LRKLGTSFTLRQQQRTDIGLVFKCCILHKIIVRYIKSFARCRLSGLYTPSGMSVYYIPYRKDETGTVQEKIQTIGNPIPHATAIQCSLIWSYFIFGGRVYYVVPNYVISPASLHFIFLTSTFLHHRRVLRLPPLMWETQVSVRYKTALNLTWSRSRIYFFSITLQRPENWYITWNMGLNILNVTTYVWNTFRYGQEKLLYVEYHICIL
jgi:hypothetical protein